MGRYCEIAMPSGHFDCLSDDLEDVNLGDVQNEREGVKDDLQGGTEQPVNLLGATKSYSNVVQQQSTGQLSLPPPIDDGPDRVPPNRSSAPAKEFVPENNVPKNQHVINTQRWDPSKMADESQFGAVGGVMPMYNVYLPADYNHHEMGYARENSPLHHEP